MKILRNVLLASLMGIGTAAAQTPMGAPEETPVDETAPVEEETTEMAAPPPAREEVSDEALIPGAAIGIGAGWIFPSADLLIPNAASARFRMASGLTFEALLNLSYQADTNETTIDGTTTDEGEDSLTTIALGANVRYPLGTRGRFQFVGVGGAAVGFSTASGEDNGTDTGTSSQVSALLSWGIGIDWFVRPNWSISFTAANPILQWSRFSQESDPVETTDSSLLIGAIWNPTISAMVHLYY